ncbi:MAG TPA: PEP-CTERM sorting domain-containing protein [Terriglobales bacterium]|nr:PEP-CTERM sorting domain-containing protein [Terriglobales bacterium]
MRGFRLSQATFARSLSLITLIALAGCLAITPAAYADPMQFEITFSPIANTMPAASFEFTVNNPKATQMMPFGKVTVLNNPCSAAIDNTNSISSSPNLIFVQLKFCTSALDPRIQIDSLMAIANSQGTGFTCTADALLPGGKISGPSTPCSVGPVTSAPPVASAPEPSALLLLGTGAIGIFGGSKIRKRWQKSLDNQPRQLTGPSQEISINSSRSSPSGFFLAV